MCSNTHMCILQISKNTNCSVGVTVVTPDTKLY